MYGVSLCDLCPYIFLENFSKNEYSQITNIVCFNLCKFSIYLGFFLGFAFPFFIGRKIIETTIFNSWLLTYQYLPVQMKLTTN